MAQRTNSARKDPARRPAPSAQYFDLFFHGFNPQVAEEMLR